MSHVYVIKCNETGLCKIGRSRDVNSRLKQIEYSSGFSCEIVHTSEYLDNSSKVEALAHRNCGGRKVGEWFKCATNEAVLSVKNAVSEIGILGSEKVIADSGKDLDFLVFWAVSGCFINQNPLAVIKYALDTFKGELSEDVLAVCNQAYTIGSGGDVDDFCDRLDLEIFLNAMTEQSNDQD